MSGSDESKQSRQVVGRGEKFREAVLAATVRELTESGYAALTIDRVAKRAGVNKTSIYRRWSDRETLVADALAELASIEIPVPDFRNVERDLRELARGFVRWATSTEGRAVLSVLLSDSGQAPEFVQARRDFYDKRFAAASPVVAGAIDRGELPAGTVPSVLLSALVAPIYFRLLVSGEPVDESAADLATDITLAAARAGVFVR